jgi:hypothetical protein
MKAAPRRRRSLLRRPRGARGAALGSRHGRGPLNHLRPAACVVAVVALVCAAPATGDDAPPPPTTTVIDAPPPDPYRPPVRTTKPKAISHPAVVHAAPSATARTYTPPSTVSPRSITRATRPKSTRVVHKRRVKPARHASKPQPVKPDLAPIARVVAVASAPLPSDPDREVPYLWLAGISFSVLAVAGLSLVLLTLRTLRPEGTL